MNSKKENKQSDKVKNEQQQRADNKNLTKVDAENKIGIPEIDIKKVIGCGG
ncbi:MAG: hypothetical protein RJQ09_03185 [Cyclobacteriaceae bacterium]